MALRNEASGASRTYVVCAEGVVVGYYCLANGAVDRHEAPKPMQRNMPDPIPVMVLGRLAVDQAFQHRKIGKALLRDAILRVLQSAEIAGIKAILVHAISDDARRFYLRHGFLESPINPMTLCLALESARNAIHESCRNHHMMRNADEDCCFRSVAGIVPLSRLDGLPAVTLPTLPH